MTKILHAFSVDREIEVEEEKTETAVNAEGASVTRTYKEKVKKNVPVEVQINMPNRRQMQEADMEYSIEISKCVKAGVLTKAMLLNQFQDSGGLISNKDSRLMMEMSKEMLDKKNELQLRSTKPVAERDPEEEKKISDLSVEIVSLNKQLIEKESSYISLFQNTADSKAQNKIILWFILNLTYFKDSAKKHVAFVPLFPGKTFEDRENKLFEFEETADEFVFSIYGKLASVISYWYFTGKVNEEEFAKMTANEPAK